jgi:hypothetical protein
MLQIQMAAQVTLRYIMNTVCKDILIKINNKSCYFIA